MSTRSTITAKCVDGKWRSIYCHSDGYLDGIGEALLTNYNTQEKIEALIAQGDHSFISLDDGNRSYHSWRGEAIRFSEADTQQECKDAQGTEEFNYVWNGVCWSEPDHPEWNALPKSPWISVTERMPEKNQFILAFGPGIGQSVDSPNIDVCLWDGYDLWDEGGTELTSETDFTHWQPIYLPNGTRL